MTPPRIHRFGSRLGPVTVVAEGDALIALLFAEDARAVDLPGAPEDPDDLLRVAQAQTEEYLEGERRAFDLPFAVRGTEFQRRVWEEVTAIPYGETRSYGEIARRLGDTNASRAVGTANGQNPLCLLVPCHRVIGRDGTLTGYAGGFPTKRALLELEGSLPRDLFSV